MYTIIPPPPSLAPYVLNFWHSYSQNLGTQTLHSDGCISILFVIIGNSAIDNTTLSNSGYLVGPHTKSLRWYFSSQCQYLLGVRLTPLGARNFTKIPLNELKNQCIELQDAVPACKHVIHDLIGQSSPINDKIRVLLQWLETQLQSGTHYLPDAFLKVNKHINLSPRSIKLSELYDTLNINSRRVERAFSQTMGISAKEFATLIEVSRARDLIKANPSTPLTEIAHQLEYADQSHFIRQFKKVMNITPKQYRKRT
ncbi:AraC family transcriptional regulator [Pseudoalteromonas luteoviolacea]|uniref:AraC family transcriptional regulator n=1 Tax=Pseudoalteromonas luteoviolacea TaxID=43657 RepID=UPI001B35BC20|nr:AraC family transcriptional regulator [Pseudoalteromonas luteoviolacea]